MIHRLILIGTLAALSLLLAPSSALAAPAAGAEAPGAGQYVDISIVALPVVHERRLVNYVFVEVRLNLARNANVGALREKEPYFRDALVKAGHRRPFVKADDFVTLDEEAIRSAMMTEGARIAGAGAITGVQVVNQAPQRWIAPPRAPPARPAGRAPG